MGGSPSHSTQKHEPTNEHFLSMTLNPETNKLVAEVFVRSSAQLNQWASDLIKVTHCKPENILLPQSYKVAEKSVCGEAMRIQIEFECYYIQLSHEINKRSHLQKYLEEGQLWYLVYCLVESAASCHRIGEPIGDVRPENIFLNRSGNLKILSKASIPNYQNPFLDYLRQKYIFSPEQLAYLRKSYKQKPRDYILSESFSIGMTVLSAANLVHMSACYDYASIQLKTKELNEQVHFFINNEFISEVTNTSIKYSNQLKNIICNLVDTNPTTRMTSLEVYDVLSPHVLSIMKLEPFDIEAIRLSPIKHIQINHNKRESVHKLRSRKKSTIQNYAKDSPNLGEEKFASHPINQFSDHDFDYSFHPDRPTILDKPVSPNKTRKLTTSILLRSDKDKQSK